MSATWKTVRVFISSTFRDMHAERDHLVKVVFSRLRQWCEERRLHLVDIDLRWGVTEAEANNGRAIEICLKEIDGSRPFFVCILGGRYGWVPDRLPPEERYRFRGLQDVTHRSITHLEVLHATDQPIATVDGQRGEVCPHAFFYLQKEGCIPPAESLAHLTDTQRQRHTETYFEHDRPQDLVELKLWIRSKFERPRQVHDYDGEWDRTAENPEDAREKPEERLVGRLANLDTFGALVYADLERAISLQFAEHIAQVPSATERPSGERLLDDEQAAHETFIENRTQIHVPRAEVEQTLNAYVWDNDHRTVVLSGPPGSGKSAVLAHWVRTRLESGEFVTPGDTAFPHQTAPRADAPLVLARFVGASPYSTNLARLLGNICEELRRRFDLQEDVENPASASSTQSVKRIQPMQVPADPNEVLRKWPKFLTAASGRGQVVIVLDAINQLDRTTDASRPYWLPRELPPGIKLIISVLDHGPRSLPDPSFNRDPTGSASAEPPDWLSVLRRMKLREIPVPALNPTEQERIIRDLPNVFCKTLEPRFVEQLLTNRATTNPLFLTVALEELRTFGSFERLPERILRLPEWREPSGDGDPMDAALDAMFGQVLDRLERESRKEALGLVPCVFGSLASAKQGLSEAELQGLLARQLPDVPARVRDGELQIVLRQVRPYLMRKAHFHAPSRVLLRLRPRRPARGIGSHPSHRVPSDRAGADRQAALPFGNENGMVG